MPNFSYETNERNFQTVERHHLNANAAVDTVLTTKTEKPLLFLDPELIFNANEPIIRCNVLEAWKNFWDLPLPHSQSFRPRGCNVTHYKREKRLFHLNFFTFHSLFSPFVHPIFSFFRVTKRVFVTIRYWFQVSGITHHLNSNFFLRKKI